MFCLRSWLPLLFIPTNASPSFIFIFFVCTYFLNRPCFYCSVLLLILFLTSCNWSDRCFFDFSSNWFQPRPPHPISPLESQCAGCGKVPGSGTTDYNSTAAEDFNATALEMLGTTAAALGTAAAEELSRQRAEWTGLGMEWLRSLLGKREWRIECLDVYIRL